VPHDANDPRTTEGILRTVPEVPQDLGSIPDLSLS
jgi:hypothetical protein